MLRQPSSSAFHFVLCALALTAAACGPSISETRMAMYPARKADCDLAIINGATQNAAIMASPNSDYEMVGMISLGEHGTQDPFSDRYMNEVKPRACKMGGDAISLMMSSQSQAGFMSATGTAYVVLRKRAQGQPTAPAPATGTLSL